VLAARQGTRPARPLLARAVQRAPRALLRQLPRGLRVPGGTASQAGPGDDLHRPPRYGGLRRVSGCGTTVAAVSFAVDAGRGRCPAPEPGGPDPSNSGAAVRCPGGPRAAPGPGRAAPEPGAARGDGSGYRAGTVDNRCGQSLPGAENRRADLV